MESILFDLGVSYVLASIKASFKNAEKKASLKKLFLKIRNNINTLYAGDSDFE